MRKLLIFIVISAVLGLTGFLVFSGNISLANFSDWLNLDEDVEGREFQSGGDASEEEISTAKSQLEGENWEYEETRTSDEFRQLSFNDGEKSAEVVIDSEGRLVEKDMEAEGLSDGSNRVIYEEQEAVEKARGSISDRNWSLESNTLLNGTYNLRFISQEYEANIKVDGSSGEVIRKKVVLKNSLYE